MRAGAAAGSRARPAPAGRERCAAAPPTLLLLAALLLAAGPRRAGAAAAELTVYCNVTGARACLARTPHGHASVEFRRSS
jgi:hypothetical protein